MAAMRCSRDEPTDIATVVATLALSGSAEAAGDWRKVQTGPSPIAAQIRARR